MNKIFSDISEITFNKGVEYFVDGKINYIEKITADEYEAEVSGKTPYHVALNIADKSLCSCTCPFFTKEKLICKHIVAVYVSLHQEEASAYIAQYKSLKASLPHKTSRTKPDSFKMPEQTSKSNKLTEEEKEAILAEKDKRAKQITKEYRLKPISEEVVVTGTYNGETYEYHPFYVGQRIKKLRKKKNITLSMLADDMSTNKQVIQMWEAGNCLPSIDVLADMANRCFGCSIDYLLLGKEKTKPKEEHIETPVKVEVVEAPIKEEPKPSQTKRYYDPTVGILFLKIFLATIYFPFWFLIGMFTFFALLPPPWRIFSSSYRSSSNNHNYDDRLTDEEFYDVVNDD